MKAQKQQHTYRSTNAVNLFWSHQKRRHCPSVSINIIKTENYNFVKGSLLNQKLPTIVRHQRSKTQASVREQSEMAIKRQPILKGCLESRFNSNEQKALFPYTPNSSPNKNELIVPRASNISRYSPFIVKKKSNGTSFSRWGSFDKLKNGE